MSITPQGRKDRDHDEYFGNFTSLPFERILEEFRLKRSIEILTKLEKKEIISVLEIGPGYNPLSPRIFPESKKTILEPSKILYEHNVAQHEGDFTTKIINEDLDTFYKSDSTKFDLVILSSVLHELPNPSQELSNINSLLKSNGLLFIVTPNNQSIHRLLGVFLGILASTSSLTSTEIKMQQHNNFSIASLQDLLNKLNFKIDLAITSFLKPHTHQQMQDWVDEGLLTKTKLDSLYELSELFDPYNSEIFVLARKHQE
jgi:SAM-dependent methyltransferase